MASKLLALFGSGSLLLIAVAAAFWAWQVMHTQPPLAPLPEIDDALPASEASITHVGRQPRPDVYFEAIVQRPVFSPSRRPVLPVAVAPEPDPQPKIVQPAAPEPETLSIPQLRLLGVISSDSSLSALVSNSGGDPSWLTEGAGIDGWTISEIGADWIALTHEQQKFRVEMYEQ